MESVHLFRNVRYLLVLVRVAYLMVQNIFVTFVLICCLAFVIQCVFTENVI